LFQKIFTRDAKAEKRHQNHQLYHAVNQQSGCPICLLANCRVTPEVTLYQYISRINQYVITMMHNLSFLC